MVRWVKFEEEVEEGGSRWSKPHVATLSLHSLFELRSMMQNCTLCLDMTASNLDDILELLLDHMVNTDAITYDKRNLVKSAISKPHRHQYEENDFKPWSSNSDMNSKKQSTASQKSAMRLIQTVSDMGMMGQGILSKSFYYNMAA